jgi:hypothetical protein
MKKVTILFYFLIPLLCLVISCKKEKKDSYSGVSGKWLFKSITVENIDAQGVVYKQKTFDNTYEDNDLTIDASGLYEVRDLPTFMFNATYCFKGEDHGNNHKGIWEFDSKKKQMWFDRGITEYFNSSSGLTFSQKYTYSLENNDLVLESTDPKVMADFGYNIGSYYFAGLWNYMSDDVYSEGNSDGYRNGYWVGYYYGSPSGEETLLSKDAFYSYWAIGVAENVADTTGAWQYPNFKTGYEDGYTDGYSDGYYAAGNVDWINNKTYKMKIVYTKL